MAYPRAPVHWLAHAGTHEGQPPAMVFRVYEARASGRTSPRCPANVAECRAGSETGSRGDCFVSFASAKQTAVVETRRYTTFFLARQSRPIPSDWVSGDGCGRLRGFQREDAVSHAWEFSNHYSFPDANYTPIADYSIWFRPVSLFTDLEAKPQQRTKSLILCPGPKLGLHAPTSNANFASNSTCPTSASRISWNPTGNNLLMPHFPFIFQLWPRQIC